MPLVDKALAFEFQKISKRFADTVANSEVSFGVQSGSIHGVVGENGAGKSTIMKILYGMYQPDEGDIFVKGTRVTLASPAQAIRRGIGMVHQHFMLVPTLSVWQNLVLGREKKWRLSKSSLLQELQTLQSSFGCSLDLEARVETLPVGQQQQIEILKLLYRKADILIFDEPTAVLTPQEVDRLFAQLRTLRSRGQTIVLITHKLREILGLTDFVTVMRAGRVVETVATSTLNESSLAEKIVGRKVTELPRHRKPCRTDVVVRLEKLSVNQGPELLKDLTLNIHAGEIVGVAGVSGNGQQVICEILSGICRRYSGRAELWGQELKALPLYELKQSGLAVVPPDRHQEGLVLDYSVQENSILGHHRNKSIQRFGFYSPTRSRAFAETLLQANDVRPLLPDIPVSSLSGGNQQKLIIGREMSHQVRFLLAAYPTRGVDIGAIELIHQLFLRARAEGAAILLISAELEEIMALSDRIVVLFQGSLTGECSRAEATEIKLGLWMTGATP